MQELPGRLCETVLGIFLPFFSSPRSAYFLFCADERPRVKAADSTLSLGDTAKELGRRWGGVDPNTKKKYEAAAAKDKERYERVRLLVFFS